VPEKIRLGQVCSYYVMLIHVRSGKFRLSGYDRLGQVNSRYARSYHVKSG